jgi:hypothetical protein
MQHPLTAGIGAAAGVRRRLQNRAFSQKVMGARIMNDAFGVSLNDALFAEREVHADVETEDVARLELAEKFPLT